MTNLNRVALSAAIPSSIARRPFTRRVERTLFHHRGCRRGKFARCGLPVIAARFARQRPLDLPAILLAATDAVDRAAFEAAAIAAGLVLEAEDDPHRGIARLFRGKLRIERLGERARRDQRAAVDRHGSARQSAAGRGGTAWGSPCKCRWAP